MSHVDEGTLHALVDDQLPPEERRAVEAHLASCDACARQFAEATHLAHETRGLLAALDVPPSRIRLAESPSAGGAAPDVVPIASRRRWITPRRMAVAASLLAVAGISYRVGRTSTDVASPAVAAAPTKVTAAAAPAARPAAPMMDSQLIASAPLRSAEPRAVGGPRPSDVLGERDLARAADAPASAARAEVGSSTGATAAPVTAAEQAVAANAMPEVAQQQQQRRDRRGEDDAAREQSLFRSDGRGANVAQAPMGAQATVDAPPPAPAPARTPQVASAGAAKPSEALRAEASARDAAPAATERARKAVSVMAGYTVVDQDVAPGRTQVRYAGTDGTILTYVVRAGAQDKEQRVEARATTTAGSYTVTPGAPESSVRWVARGATHELRGALRPDSLMKLAALLR